MKRTGLLVAALMALATVAIATPAAAQNESLTIGQQISLVATDSGHEVRSQVQDRAFGIALNRSENRHQVVQHRVQELHERIMEAQQERQGLLQKLQNGSIAPQEFAARITAVNREISRTARSMNNVESETESAGLEVNATEGLNESLRNAVNALKNRAAANVSVLDNAFQAHELARKARSGNFTGPEISEFARQLGFNRSRVGPPGGVPGGPPGDRGAPDNRTNGTERPDESGNDTGGRGAADGAAGRP